MLTAPHPQFTGFEQQDGKRTPCYAVQPLDEAGRTKRRGPRQRPRRGVVGGHERQVQEVINRDPLAGSQVGVVGTGDVGPLDGYLAGQVRVPFEDHCRGHHLGDARD